MVSVVITACGRIELLKRTIDSFYDTNTYPITEFIIVEDSGKEENHNRLRKLYPEHTLILNPKNRGQIACVDDAYSRVKTKYIFHSEDDWEYRRSGFIERSMIILETLPNIMQVWLRGVDGSHGHPIEPAMLSLENIQYRYMTLLPAHDPAWHGFSFNPGLRRLGDFQKIMPLKDIGKDGVWPSGRNPGKPLPDFAVECEIGEAFYQLGLKAVTLLDEYCVHIGGQDSVYQKQGHYK